MTRAIIRLSLDHDAGGTQIQVADDLEAAGFVKIGAASYEGLDLPVGDILAALDRLTNTLQASPGGGTLDHLWIVVDEPDKPAAQW